MLMLKIFITFTIATLLPSIFIYFKVKIRKAKPWLRYYFWILPVLVTLGLAYLSFGASGEFLNSNEVIMGWLIMAYFALIIPRLILSIILLISLPFYAIYKGLTRPLLIVSFVLALIVEGGLIYGVFIGRNQFDVKPFTFEIPHLPKSFNNYKIVQLSDLHMGGWSDNKAAFKRLITLVNKQKADLIVFTGDLVNHRAIELKGFESLLSQLEAPDGVYSVLGNHDYGTYYKFWKNKSEERSNLENLIQQQESFGWQMLNNDHTFIYRDNDSIALIGVENEGEPPFSQYGDLHKAMAGTEECFQILLSHNPSHWEREVLDQSNIDLMLAGHTHAMQLKLFSYSPAVLKYKEWSGPYYYGNRALYVNIGAGEVGIPFRLGAWPEITVITLKHKAS